MRLFFKNLVVGVLLGVSVLTVAFVLSANTPPAIQVAVQSSYVRTFV